MLARLCKTSESIYDEITKKSSTERFRDSVFLQDVGSIPSSLHNSFSSMAYLFKEEDFLCRLFENKAILQLAKELNDYCINNTILAIHYTHAISFDIEQTGLLIRSGKEIRNTFIERFSDHFTHGQFKSLQENWQWIDGQSDSRNNRLYFNFTLDAYDTDGSDLLLGMYGGEQIHMGTNINSEVGKILAAIGEPLIVISSIAASEIRISTELPWGRILLSALHRSVNSNAYCEDFDGQISKPVAPKDLFLIKLTEGTQRT